MENNNQNQQNQNQQGAAGTGTGSAAGAPNAGQQAQEGGTTIDYNKIQQMLDGALAAKEDTALKAYFKQQGLSQQEAEQAMTAFKQQKAANQPDVAGMQAQVQKAQQDLQTAQAAALNAQIQSAATMAAVALGIDAKSIPYVLKMADLSQVTDKDGKILDEAMNTALNKVLEDVPALKPQAAGQTGFRQIGTGGNPSQNTQQGGTGQASQVATKKWNRFN